MEDIDRRAQRHAALGDPTRLRIVDALVLGDLTPSDLHEITGSPSNLLAHHLGVLEHAGLVRRARSEGDHRRSYARLDRGALSALNALTVLHAPRVLFLCSANSARSPLAVALWARVSTVPAISAGVSPAQSLADKARAAARRAGLELPDHRPVAVADVIAPDDVIVTVCDRAREALRDRDGLRGRRALHWSVANPGRPGTDAAYDRALAELRDRTAQLAPLVLAR